MSVNLHEEKQWADAPLEFGEVDLLGRSQFVTTVVSRIRRSQATDPSTVYGLVGEWGSGKTSILSDVKQALKDDWLVAQFTPWSSGDATSMSLEFVSTLAELLETKASGENKEIFAKYASYAAPALSLIPFVGGAAQGAAERAIEAFGERKPWHTQFLKLSEEIEALGKRVLIMVDDVDRLGSEELLYLLRIVRLLGRFNGVHYLLAYDQETVEDLLKAGGSVGRSSSYMEKIVQHPFEVPPIPRATIMRLVDEMLAEVLSETGCRLSSEEMARWDDLVGLLSRQIHTPRTLNRYREHLLAFSSHVQSAELDVLDYVAVTWLRLNAHEVWAQLGRWREELVRGSRLIDLFESENISEAEWEKRIVGVGGQEKDYGSLETLAFLFPGVLINGESRYKEHKFAVSDGRYLERYLLLNIPENDVSDELVASAVEAIRGGVDTGELLRTTEIIDGDNTDLAGLVLSLVSQQRESDPLEAIRMIKYFRDRIRFLEKQGDRERLKLTLSNLLAHETALAIQSEVIEVSGLVEILGEDRILSLLRFLPRTQNAQSDRRALMKRFGIYWLGQLPGRYEDLKAKGQAAVVLNLLSDTSDRTDLNGILDGEVTNYEDYVEFVACFVQISEWYGISKSYELEFRDDAFLDFASEALRNRYEHRISQAAKTNDYHDAEFLSPEVSRNEIEAFAIHSVNHLMS